MTLIKMALRRIALIVTFSRAIYVLGVILLNVVMLSVILLNVIMLSVILLNAVILSVILINVVTPFTLLIWQIPLGMRLPWFNPQFRFSFNAKAGNSY
jgi:hypothetical protein